MMRRNRSSPLVAKSKGAAHRPSSESVGVSLLVVRYGAHLVIVGVLALTLVVAWHGGPSSPRAWQSVTLLLDDHGAARMETRSLPAPSSLAYRQSFGFFDSIDDEDWKQRQERARRHRHHQSSSGRKRVDEQTDVSRWYMDNYFPLFTCPNQQRIGVGGDGPKWTCDPRRLTLQQQRQNTDQRCLVYSVGSNGNYAFEDALVELLGAGTCEIHVFDMTRDYSRKGDAASKEIYFHKWGLGSSYSNAGRLPKYTYLTLQETMDRLNHTGRTLDIFKVDCEQCEWTSYKDWIRGDVDIRQLLVETHGLGQGRGVPVNPYDFFDDIQMAGFAMFSKEPNIHPRVGGRCVEWGFVRLHREFFGQAESVTSPS